MRRLLLLSPLLLAGCTVASAAGSILGGSLAQLVAPIRAADAHVATPVRKDTGLAVLWIGHATLLLQLDDKIVLTDPVLTPTAGYFSKRLVAPGLTTREIPPLDAVLVSHMHLDHLSLDSLFALRRRTRRVVVPEGGAVYLPDAIEDPAELAPWQSVDLDGLRITAVPVQHVGWRYGLDALWRHGAFSGYVIEYGGHTVYFAGDTAFAPAHFEATRQRFPHLDLAILPIAPLGPRKFMARTHMDPTEALQAFELLGAKWMVPMHFDTFINSTDQVGDAVRALELALEGRADRERVVRLGIGEQRIFLKRGQ